MRPRRRDDADGDHPFDCHRSAGPRRGAAGALPAQRSAHRRPHRGRPLSARRANAAGGGSRAGKPGIAHCSVSASQRVADKARPRSTTRGCALDPDRTCLSLSGLDAGRRSAHSVRITWVKALVPLLLLLGTLAAFGATPISTPPLGPGPHPSLSPRILALGDGFLAVWSELDLTTIRVSNVKCSRLDRQGHPGDVATLISGIGNGFGLLNAASDGDSAFILVADSTDFTLLRVDADGTASTVSRALPLSSNFGYGSAMAVTGGYILFFAAP